jgi:nucleotide-binding universal stress UspA family protein
MSAFRKILVPTDFSQDAREAFRVAYDLAKPTGASVVMLHITPLPAVVSDGDRPLSAPVQTEAKDVRDELRMIPATVPAVRVEFAMIVADQPDATHILRILDERGCDLIVIGTHLRSGRKDGLFGSVTEDVVRRAKCAVIVVMAPAREAGAPSHPNADQPASRVKS